MSTANQSLLGQTIADRYQVISLLGEGGMGRVYLAEHLRMGRKSAVKVLSPELTYNADAISRFHREAANASRINHPNVAAIYDFGETSTGLLYLAMEFVEGPTLRTMLARERRIDLLRAVKLVEQAANALAAAHHLGFVHRDIKPDNIMVTRSPDGSELVKVVDFGIAKTVDERNGSQNLTTVGVSIGTPEYMSPEQLAGDKLDARTDVYSLGLVLFHMLTGGMPFPTLTSRETLVKRLTAAPRRLDEVAPDIDWPVGIQRALDRALSPDLERRYSSVGDFGRDLVEAAQAYLSGRATRPHSSPRIVEPPTAAPAHRGNGWGLTLAVLAVAIGAAAYLTLHPNIVQGIIQRVIRAPSTRTVTAPPTSATTHDSTRAPDSAVVTRDSSAANVNAAAIVHSDSAHQVVTDSAIGRAVTDSTHPKRDSVVVAAPTHSTAAAATTPAPITVDSTKRQSSVPAPSNVIAPERGATPVAKDSSSNSASTPTFPRAHRFLRFTGDTSFALTLITRSDSISAASEDVQGHFERSRQLFLEGHPVAAQFELMDASAELRALYGRMKAGEAANLEAIVKRLQLKLYETCLSARSGAAEKEAPRYQCERLVPRS